MLIGGSDGLNRIAAIWEKLPSLRVLSITATSGRASSTNWAGAGQAAVRPEVRGADWVLSERGRFTPTGSAAEVNFTNVYRWQLGKDRLRLYHERRGAAEAEFLLEFVGAGRGCLVARRPHVCGADTYSGSIILTGAGLDLIWAISGPRKDERLLCRYRIV